MQREVKLGLILGVIMLAIGILFWSQSGENIPVEDYVYDSGFRATAAELIEPVPPSIVSRGTARPQQELAVGAAGDDLLAPPSPAQTLNPDLDQPRREPEPASRAEAGSRIHVASRSETLWGLAERYYGNGNKWRLIAEANRPAIPESNVLQPGMELVIPPETANGASSATAASASQTRTHIVQPGDSLSKLSNKYYGSERHWRKLLEANRQSVPNPESLQVGTRLVIPPMS